MMSERRCPTCRRPLSDEEKFCTECGSRIDIQSTRKELEDYKIKESGLKVSRESTTINPFSSNASGLKEKILNPELKPLPEKKKVIFREWKTEIKEYVETELKEEETDYEALRVLFEENLSEPEEIQSGEVNEAEEELKEIPREEEYEIEKELEEILSEEVYEIEEEPKENLIEEVCEIEEESEEILIKKVYEEAEVTEEIGEVQEVECEEEAEKCVETELKEEETDYETLGVLFEESLSEPEEIQSGEVNEAEEELKEISSEEEYEIEKELEEILSEEVYEIEEEPKENLIEEVCEIEEEPEEILIKEVYEEAEATDYEALGVLIEEKLSEPEEIQSDEVNEAAEEKDNKEMAETNISEIKAIENALGVQAMKELVDAEQITAVKANRIITTPVSGGFKKKEPQVEETKNVGSLLKKWSTRR